MRVEKKERTAAKSVLFIPALRLKTFRDVFEVYSRLVPFDIDVVLSKLDVKFGSQSTLVKKRIQRHLDSPPNSMVEAYEKMAKGVALITCLCA